jgi:hypothetical protein
MKTNNTATSIWLGHRASIWARRGYKVQSERVMLDADDNYSRILHNSFDDADQLVKVRCDNAIYYYDSQEDADLDQEGTNALAVVNFGEEDE